MSITAQPVVTPYQKFEDPTDPNATAQQWLTSFESALTKNDAFAVANLFQPDGWWRDVLTMTWEFHTYHGREKIVEIVTSANVRTGFRNFKIEEKERSVVFVQVAPKLAWLQVFYTFEVKVGKGRGIFRLTKSHEGWKAYTVFTALQEIAGHPEPLGSLRPQGVIHGEQSDRKSWLEQRAEEKEFVNTEPTVVIIGSGQAGLTIAARLKMLGIKSLIIELNDRVGDNWRKRYKALVLHDPIWYDHLPYIPFPQHWPVFTPKDKLAEWFELYASSLELNVWTKTSLQHTDYDENQQIWSVQVTREDGSVRTLHPEHVIQATGHSGEPNIVKFEDVECFTGTFCHSSQHLDGADWTGKKAIVIGCCNSGHDIAHDFYEQGAESVTIVQRSSTYIMSSKHGLNILFEGLYEEGGPSTEDADEILASIPYPVQKEIHQELTRRIAEEDKNMLEGLAKVGFKLDYGFDGTGFLMKYFIRGGGYYIDVGCSKLIADGKIKIKQGQEIKKFTKTGILFADDSELQADIIVAATGYQNMRVTTRKIMGNKVADRCKDVWGLNEEGEIATVWQNSGHPRFWYMGGNLALCRTYSKYLALKIKAIEEGLVVD